MPNSAPDSSGSLPPSATHSASAPLAWRTNLWLFLATVVSIVGTRTFLIGTGTLRERAAHGAEFAGTILAILLAHEFGHYIAARIHKVDASLPYFIPMPMTLIGTMGAVIRMRGTIPTRAALLDIGASGPLAGMAVAIPMYILGVRRSTPISLDGFDGGFLGEPILTRVLDHFFAPHFGAGMDMVYSPMAEAAWAGMLVTMINLVPVGQLDGGHVAYALFGPRQDRIAPWVHRSMLVFFFVSLASYTVRDLRSGWGFIHLDKHVANSLFWLMWFEVQAVLGAVASRGRPRDATELPNRTRILALAGVFALFMFGHESRSTIFWIGWFGSLAAMLALEVRFGVLRKNTLLDHPPTGAAPLGTVRTIVAVFSLVLFVLLFMPTPIAL